MGTVAIRQLLTSLIALFLLGSPMAYGQDPKFQRFFVNKTDQRGLAEKLFNSVGIQSSDVGRSFALIVGVWNYPNLSPIDRQLDAAWRDVSLLRAYLAEQERFDEIVVLANEDFTEDNLRYFLQSYFPQQLRASPGSRFFFGFSGHGFDSDNEGFILRSNATSLADELNSLPMAALRSFLNSVTRLNAKVGVFINACSSGNFQTRSFGPSNFFIRQPGAHAITASRAGQASLAIGKNVGSVFFESLLTAVSKGYADTYPPAVDGKGAGDGIITMGEAFSWLHPEIKMQTNNRQQPLLGDLRTSNDLGSFFFLNQQQQIAASNVPVWDPRKVVLFGSAEATAAAPTLEGSPRPRDVRSASITASERTLGSNIDAPEATTKIEKDKAQARSAQDEKAAAATSKSAEAAPAYTHLPTTHLPTVAPGDTHASTVDNSKEALAGRSTSEAGQSYHDPTSFKRRGFSEPAAAFVPDFRRPGVVIREIPPPVSADQLRQNEKRDQVDRTAYRAAEALNTAAGYRKYLRDFENGIYASAARTQLERVAAVLDEPDEPRVDKATRIGIQKSLEFLGHDVGGLDGVFGPKTRAAIEDWQRRRAERVPTGFLSKAQMEELLGPQESPPSLFEIRK